MKVVIIGFFQKRAIMSGLKQAGKLLALSIIQANLTVNSKSRTIGQPACLINGRVRNLLQFSQRLSHDVNVVNLQEHEFSVWVGTFTFIAPTLCL